MCAETVFYKYIRLKGLFLPFITLQFGASKSLLATLDGTDV
jgi:hypothetical protein